MPSSRLRASRATGLYLLWWVLVEIALIFVAMLFWANAPRVIGWQPALVTSGSMSPAISTGDVVLYAPVAGNDLKLGAVLVVDDPVRRDALLTHRLVEIRGNGALVLKGDANAAPDSSVVLVEDVHGTVRLRVPAIGLPVVWWHQRYLPGLVATALLLLACAAAIVAGEPDAAPAAGAHRAGEDGHGGGEGEQEALSRDGIAGAPASGEHRLDTMSRSLRHAVGLAERAPGRYRDSGPGAHRK